jgi:hypothetical protein
VVVNDAIVLIERINENIAEGSLFLKPFSTAACDDSVPSP